MAAQGHLNSFQTPSKTAQVLQRYLSFYRPDPANPRIDSFFLNADGEAITTNAVKMLVQRASSNAQVPRLHAHLLRHTYGLRTHELGVDPLDLQARMGHASVGTTQRYAHAAESERLKLSQVSYLDQLPIKVKKVGRSKGG
jgi:integrase/recombinase XerC